MPCIASESRTRLWTLEDDAELAFQLGKVHNLRTAARRLDGLLLRSGEVFSFWRQVGRATRGKGYVAGRMLQQGCFMPSVGGGMCQLSNSLYKVALEAGCEIVERHAHSRVVPGSEAAFGRDATVAWNYVDLRFRPKQDLQLEVRLSKDELIVRLRALKALRLPMWEAAAPEGSRQSANNCFSCGEEACLHHTRAMGLKVTRTRTAFLMDENWPEFQTWAGETATERDALFVPLNGARWGVQRYRWPVDRFGEVRQALWPALQRSWTARRLAAQGAERQRALLGGAEALARSYGAGLTPDMTQIVVAQSLLPFLWRDGHLGGREFTVVMTRLPALELQRRLDQAFLQHPEQATLADFRAPEWFAQAEAEALAAAHAIVTPHSDIARLFEGRARRLAWQLPKVQPVQCAGAGAIGFPGPAVARRGAYAVREAARELGLRVVVHGSSLEGSDFWAGLAEPAGPGWLARVQMVVLPAIVEHQPRALLTAIAAGVPVVATRACGVESQPGVTIIESDDQLLVALREQVGRVLV